MTFEIDIKNMMEVEKKENGMAQFKAGLILECSGATL